MDVRTNKRKDINIAFLTMILFVICSDCIYFCRLWVPISIADTDKNVLNFISKDLNL